MRSSKIKTPSATRFRSQTLPNACSTPITNKNQPKIINGPSSSSSPAIANSTTQIKSKLPLRTASNKTPIPGPKFSKREISPIRKIPPLENLASARSGKNSLIGTPRTIPSFRKLPSQAAIDSPRFNLCQGDFDRLCQNQNQGPEPESNEIYQPISSSDNEQPNLKSKESIYTNSIYQRAIRIKLMSKFTTLVDSLFNVLPTKKEAREKAQQKREFLAKIEPNTRFSKQQLAKIGEIGAKTNKVQVKGEKEASQLQINLNSNELVRIGYRPRLRDLLGMVIYSVFLAVLSIFLYEYLPLVIKAYRRIK